MPKSFRDVRPRVVLIGVLAGVLAHGYNFASAADAPQISQAGGIADECSSAESSLRTTRDLAVTVDGKYRTALYTAESHVVQAYRLSLMTPWTDDMSSTRTRLNNSLLVTIGKLSHLDRPPLSWKTADLRSALDKEIVRMHRAVALLDGWIPPTDVVAAPVQAAPAPPPAPAPTPAPVSSTTPVLVPGTNFTGPTQQPSTVGTGKYSDAKAIARWDVIPYQWIKDSLTVGVVAFHVAGIDRVEFSMNNGPWVAVNQMTQNPVTKVWEYNVTVDPKTMPDGSAIEVRAVVYPKVGIPRVLDGRIDDGNDKAFTHGEYSLFLTSNGSGTLPERVRYVSPTTGCENSGDGTETHPFATITAAAVSIRDTPAPYTNNAGAGATIYLDANLDYEFAEIGYGPSAWNGYITIAGKPGLSADQVRITHVPVGGHGLNTQNVCLRNLTLYGDIQIPSGSPEMAPRMWVDKCVLDGGGKDVYPVYFDPNGSWHGGIFVTSSVIKNTGRAAYGFQFMRDVQIHDVGEDAIRNSGGVVINCTVRDLVPIVNGVHPDLVQWNAPPGSQIENIIVYGLSADNVNSQGLFIRQNNGSATVENLAFVNCDMKVAGNSQFLYDINHMLIWNCNFLPVNGNGGNLLMSDDTEHITTIHNLSLRNSVVTYFSLHCTNEPLLTDSSWADQNHFMPGSPGTPGTNMTTGGTFSTLFRSYPADDTPAVGSPLLGRVTNPVVPADLTGVARTVPDAVGAYGAH